MVALNIFKANDNKNGRMAWIQSLKQQVLLDYISKFKGTPNEACLPDNQVILYNLIMAQFERIPVMIPVVEPTAMIPVKINKMKWRCPGCPDDLFKTMKAVHEHIHDVHPHGNLI